MDQTLRLPIGESKNPDSFNAGAEAALQSLAVSPSLRVGWVFAICGGRHDPEFFLRGIRSVLGEVLIYGGSGVGTITSRLLGSSGYECAVVIWPDSISAPKVTVQRGLDTGEWEAGKALGMSIAAHGQTDSVVLLFYDSLRSSSPAVLHVGSKLMDGVYAGLDRTDIQIIGAGMLGDLNLERSFVFDGVRALKHAAVAALLPSCVEARTTIMHGCYPASSFLEITRIEGAKVYELDGRPAVEAMADRLGYAVEELTAQNILSLALTLGQKYGDPFEPFDEGRYVNRLVIGADPQEGSVTLFEADFAIGTRVQIMVTDPQYMVDSAQRRTVAFIGGLNARRAMWALYIDCAGRSAPFHGTRASEASIVRQSVGADIPFLGFYSGVEIAPFLGRSRPLDWTGVLVCFMVRA